MQGEMQVVVKGEVVVKAEVVMKGAMQGVMKGAAGTHMATTIATEDIVTTAQEGKRTLGIGIRGCGIVAEGEARGEEEDQTVRKHAARSSK